MQCTHPALSRLQTAQPVAVAERALQQTLQHGSAIRVALVVILMPFASIATLTLILGVMAIVVGLTQVIRVIGTRVEIGRLAAGTTTQRRPLFHARPHPQP